MPTRETIDLSGTTVSGVSAGLRGFLGRPDGDGPWPGLVMMFEAFGADDANLRLLDRAASLGYLVLMPDLYSQGGTRRCLVSTIRSMRSGEGRAFRDIEAARQWLASCVDCTGAVGAIGFCTGGGFALMTANRGFDATAVNYGMAPKDLDAAVDGACPIVGSYGGRDRSLPGVAKKLDQALTRADVPHDVKEYPAAGHAYLDEVGVGPRLMRPISRAVMGVGHRPEEAADTWARIDAFFTEHLRTGAPGSA